MNFKEAYADDLNTTFFDMDEFATEHTIDGVKYSVVLTRNDTQQEERPYNSTRPTPTSKERDIARYTQKVYIRDTDLKRKITPHSTIKFDGQNYFVDDVDHVEGVYILYLVRNGM
ncbi:MAG: hypothetical protein IJL91_06955 [Bacteroidales bacterium]|nr:hypothetical protein [Bacteroidales bacterium]